MFDLELLRFVAAEASRPADSEPKNAAGTAVKAIKKPTDGSVSRRIRLTIASLSGWLHAYDVARAI